MSLLSGYICGVINVVVFLQWAQVYRVISNPGQASQTFVTNWAVKMECAFVLVFTIIMVGSIYTSMYDHFKKNFKEEDSPLDVAKTTFQVVNSIILFIVILLYISLLYLF